MPEADVVWRTAARLHAALGGQVLLACDLRWPTLANLDLTGRTVVEVRARGKHLLLRMDGDPALTLHSHLRMEGSWQLYATDHARPRAGFGRDVRAVLVNQRWTAVGHRLGMLDVVARADEHTLVGHLGPDVLGAGWDPAGVAARMRALPERAVGAALLDQRVLAGVGTMYMAEALFVRGLSPWTPVGAVTDLERLLVVVRHLIEANLGRAVQASTGDLRAGHERWVHARSGRECRRCGSTVRVATIGPASQERPAFYCPPCQPGPTPTDDGRPQRPLGAVPRRRAPYR